MGQGRSLGRFVSTRLLQCRFAGATEELPRLFRKNGDPTHEILSRYGIGNSIGVIGT